VATASATSLWQRHGHEPAIDPLGKHCFDVSVDTTDPKAKEWLSANLYEYVNFTAGLCDKTVYPVVENMQHPSSLQKVTLRKMGHNAPAVEVLSDEAVTTKDCRTDKTTEKITISMTNGAGTKTKIRACQNQYACKPYVDCDLTFADGGHENVVIDKTSKYMIFSYYGKYAGKETALYPDANMLWPTDYTIKAPTSSGEVTMLSSSESGSEEWFYHVDDASGDHKCREANFTMAGITTKGRCPTEYTVFEKNETDKVCRTGGNIKYCPAADIIEVTINTWGKNGAWHHSLAGNQCFEANFTMNGLNLNGSCPSNFGVLEKKEIDKLCRLGGNVKYCPSRDIITVEINTRGINVNGTSDLVETSTEPFVIYSIAAGAAHCTELSFEDGKTNPYYKAHGYQYQPPTWETGTCPKKYNWFNKKTTIAPKVTQTLKGIHV